MSPLSIACPWIQHDWQISDYVLHSRSQCSFFLQTLKNHKPNDHCKTEDAAMAALFGMHRVW
jgi:hypothetical protein